jgi:hypothetical protein
MTAAVVATEAAQMASKAESSKKVGETVVKGFFGLIQGEISQQMTELAAAIPSKIQELNNFAARCVALRQQMERDFHRIRDRYCKLFGDLDHELNLRIKRLNSAAFSLGPQNNDPTVADSDKNTNVTMSLTSGSEIQSAQSNIVIYTMRQRALSMIQCGQKHIASAMHLNEGINAICEDISADVQQAMMVPIILIEMDDLDGKQNMHLILSENSPYESAIRNGKDNIIKSAKESTSWSPMTSSDQSRLGEKLSQAILKNTINADIDRNQRETELIQQLWKNMKISCLQGASL